MNGELRIAPEIWLELVKQLNRQVKGRNIPVERPSDFWDKLLDLACTLEKADPSPKFGDVNLISLWYASMLLVAWVQTLGNAKLYDPSRKGLSDAQRRELRDLFATLHTTARSVSELGMSLGKEFQRQHTENLREGWETSEDS